MDIGDFIFFFIVILVIIGRALSWVFKEFVDKAPGDTKDSPQQGGIMNQVVEWLRSLEQSLSQPVQTPANPWKDLEPEPLYSELQPTPKFDFVEVPSDARAVKTCKQKMKPQANCQQRISKKIRSRQLNLKDAIIHYEIIGPPLALRQEY
ncbi:MAG: hypothetical protein HQK75_19950 [Candidatus Magnetomorum sp.]|nr:hypothetical protein [Candidatus Magnetomorum sp.]